MKAVIRPVLLSLLLVGLLGWFLWARVYSVPETKMALPAPEAAAGSSFVPVLEFIFDDPSKLEGWYARDFKGRTIFEVHPSPEGEKTLRCTSQNTSSALFKEIDAPNSKRLYFVWDWRMVKFPEWKTPRNQLSDKRGHDFGARVYVIFKGNIPMQHDIIQYVWDKDFEEGAFADGPTIGTIHVKVIVTRHGEPSAAGWVTERRDLAADYQKVFGKPLQKELKVMGIMVDSDDSVSSSEVLIRRMAVEIPMEGNAEQTLEDARLESQSKAKELLPINGVIKFFSRPIKMGAKVGKKVIGKTIDTTKEGLQSIVELNRKDEDKSSEG